MILKGSQRGGGQNLAVHLMRVDDNEHMRVPVFAGFCELLFGIHIKEALYPYLFIGGYVGGSIGIGILMAEQNGGETGAIDFTPPQLPSEPQRSLPRPEPEPFRYASWDDEEERGQ